MTCDCDENSPCRISGNCTCNSKKGKDHPQISKLLRARELRDSNSIGPTCRELMVAILVKKGFNKKFKSPSTKKLAKKF